MEGYNKRVPKCAPSSTARKRGMATFCEFKVNLGSCPEVGYWPDEKMSASKERFRSLLSQSINQSINHSVTVSVCISLRNAATDRSCFLIGKSRVQYHVSPTNQILEHCLKLSGPLPIISLPNRYWLTFSNERSNRSTSGGVALHSEDGHSMLLRNAGTDLQITRRHIPEDRLTAAWNWHIKCFR
jgi:hypothetical protein